MALCGVSPKMLNGITTLLDGAIEYGILERAKNKGITLEEQYASESIEITSFILNSRNIKDSATQKQIEGIALLVGGTFEKDRQRGTEKYLLTHASDARLLKDLDDHFYGALRGDVNNMSKLFEWVNNNLYRYT
jgi:hypothetical protein